MNDNFSHTNPSSATDPIEGGKRSFWQRLVEPVATITESGERRHYRLVSSILLVVGLSMSFGVVMNTFVIRSLTTALILAGSVFVLGVAYSLTRTRYYRLGMPLLLAVTALYSTFSVIIEKNFSAEGLLSVFIFNILAILLSGTLASFRTTVFLSIANFLGLLLLPQFIPAISYRDMILPVIFNGVVSVITLVLTQHRNRVERDRQTERDRINTALQANLAALQASNTALDARTRGLNLAIEVSRSVSQVGSLAVMLTEAAELIRKQFDLYYVQMYLTDQSRTSLRLEAGTGSVGEQLLGNRHALPLSSNSINGRAAVEKRSVVISDTTQSPAFRPNPLLPETRGEIAVPLIVADTVVGVLDIQSSAAGVLTDEILPAFEALAGQLAVAIQNANLLAEAENARAEVEKQARYLVRTGWNEHLDAIHKPEQLRYVFDQNGVKSVETDQTPSYPGDKAVSVPLAVTGESLGSITVEFEDEERTELAIDLLNVVARQVAQQIENLRVLERAERYRADAEQAVRQQTHANWQEYFHSGDVSSLSYLYDLNEVRPYESGREAPENALALPLKVRDETIGKLAVQGLAADDRESLDLLHAIAERLTSHIEGLRQSAQTKSALAQSENLFEASRSLTQANDLQHLVNVAVHTLKIPVVNRAILVSFNYSDLNSLDSMDVIANWWNGTGEQATPVGTHYPLEVVRVMPMFVSPTAVFFNDAFNDERVDATTMQLVKRLNLRAVAVLPLHAGGGQIGALILEAEAPHNFSSEEIRLFTAIAPQIATVLDNRRQFERAQKQAERESRLNVISQKIQSATTVEAVLQIAARELGHTLGAPLTIAQLGLKEHANSNA